MSCRKHIFGFGLLAAMATTAPVYAQSTAGAAPNVAADFPVCTKTVDSDIAKQRYIAARQDYEEGSYDSALRRFKDSYANDCTKPEVLLIVSATYERKGDRPSALAALETYVQRAPKDAPDMATTQAKIENLKKQIASQPPATTTQTTTQTSNGDVQEHTIYPWILVGAGAAAVVVGVIFIVAAPSLPKNCTTNDPKTGMRSCSLTPGESEASLANDRTTAVHSQGWPIGGGIAVGVGGAAVIGGIIWHFLEPAGANGANAKEKSATLVPSISASFAGLTFGSKF